VIPLLRADLKDDSAVAEAVNAVQAELQTEDLTAMNREVDVERRNPEEAAEAWLTEKGLV